MIGSDLTNKKFGRLLVLSIIPRKDKKQKWGSYWSCKCDCGSIRNYRATALRAGTVKSCGCLREELLRKSPGEANKHSLYCQYKAGAKRREIDFSLSKKDFLKLIEQNCYYCRQPLSQKIKAYKASKNTKEWIEQCIVYYNGIDRKNNNIGYILENCLTCCKTCNYAKHKMDLSTFKEWLIRISKNINNI